MRLRTVIAVSVIILSYLRGIGQTLSHDDGVSRWEVGLAAGLNNDGYELDARVYCFPIAYTGIKFGLGVAGEIKQIGDWGEDDWDTGHYYASRIRLVTALAFRSPCLINMKSQEGGIYLFSEPGVVISPGAGGSRNARWLSWDVKSGINLQIYRYVFTLGYGISNFTLYSGRPDSMNGLPDNCDYLTHTVFVACAWQF